MPFFQLETVQATVAGQPSNPLSIYGSGFRIPNIICEASGRWGGSDQIRVDVPERPELLQLLKRQTVPQSDWEATMEPVAKALAVALPLLRPGAEVGQPTATLNRHSDADFLDLGGPGLWVTRRVVDALETHAVSGVRFAKVNATWQEPESLFRPVPDHWEIVVTGCAWRAGMSLDRVVACASCGRREFPEPGWMQVDESRWDRTDFLRVDMNPNITLVTERVRNLLAEHGFSGYRCIAVPYVIEGPSWRS